MVENIYSRNRSSKWCFFILYNACFKK